MKNPSSVVTGAAGGLGRAFCEELGRRGGRVLVSDIDEVGAEATAELVRRHGGEALAVRCDVSDPAQVEALAEAARARFGCVDLLVNNAGVAVAGPVDEVSLEDWRWIMGINLWGVVHGCRTFLPAMRARGSGAVINVASAAGLMCAPMMAPYNVTKAAVVALSETMHSELRAAGVHVSVLCPTFFATDIARSGRGAVTERLRGFIEQQMSRSRVQAPDVARAALAAVAKNQLYVLPMADGRALWRLRRLHPERFSRLLGLAFRLRGIQP